MSSERLDPHAKGCPACGTVFVPDAKAVKDQIEDDLWDSKAEASEEEQWIDMLKQLFRENPSLLEEVPDSRPITRDESMGRLMIHRQNGYGRREIQ